MPYALRTTLTTESLVLDPIFELHTNNGAWRFELAIVGTNLQDNGVTFFVGDSTHITKQSNNTGYFARWRLTSGSLSTSGIGDAGIADWDGVDLLVGAFSNAFGNAAGNSGFIANTDFVATSYNRVMSIANVGESFTGDIKWAKAYINGVLAHHWLNESGTGNVLPDIVGSKDMVLTGFPTDDSQWVFYGEPSATPTLTPPSASSITANSIIPNVTLTF